MLQQTEKYLYVPYGQTDQSIGSRICELESIINIALSIKRIPIIKEYKSSPDIPVGWQRYINLSATRILKVVAGEIQELSQPLQYLYEKDFDFSLYPQNQVRHVNIDQLYDKENENYPVICLAKGENIGGPQTITPHLHRDLSNINTARADGFPYFSVIFSPSDKVNDLTDIVLDYFSVNRSYVELLDKIQLSQPSARINHTNFFKARKLLIYYACIDTRHEREPNALSRLVSKYTTKKKVKVIINKVHHRGHDKRMPFYIMSGIRNSNYFDSLKSRYNVYSYTDFKNLKAGITQNGRIDYDLLSLIENNIMRYALVKIPYGQMNRFVFEGPWSNIPGGIEESLWQKINRFIKS